MYKSFDFLNFEVHYISEWNENNYYKNITTFYIQGEHFKLSRSLRYHYPLTKRLTENLFGFGIVGTRATKHYFRTYDLVPSLDPFKRDLEQYGVLQARRTYSSLTH